jgi:hypothetical protein
MVNVDIVYDSPDLRICIIKGKRFLFHVSAVDRICQLVQHLETELAAEAKAVADNSLEQEYNLGYAQGYEDGKQVKRTRVKPTEVKT